MALTDHVGIIAQSAVINATPNRKKPGAPLQFYAQVAYPPAAGPDLNKMLQDTAAAANFTIRFGVTKIGVQQNGMMSKPLPGIPSDWLVLRASSQFPPELYNEAAELIDRNDPSFATATRSRFFAGKRVRIQATPWYWPNENGGLSWNLHAVMDAGEGGERIAGIGGGADPTAFAKHAKAAAAPAAQQEAAPTANPFGAPQQTAQPAQQANPFAQATGSANPFGTQAA